MKKIILILLALAWLVAPAGAAQYLNGVGLQGLQAFFDWLATNTYVQTESDPVYGADAAAGITADNTQNWTTAYGWGDHSAAGYVATNDAGYTSTTAKAASAVQTESDPVFVESPAKNLASNDLVLARAAVQPDTVHTALSFSAYRIIQLTNGLGLVTLEVSCDNIADPESTVGWDAVNNRRPMLTNTIDSFEFAMLAGDWEGRQVVMSFDYRLDAATTNWGGSLALSDGGTTMYVEQTPAGDVLNTNIFTATYGCTSTMPAELHFEYEIIDTGGGEITYHGVSNILVRLEPCGPATTNKISVE